MFRNYYFELTVDLKEQQMREGVLSVVKNYLSRFSDETKCPSPVSVSDEMAQVTATKDGAVVSRIVSLTCWSDVDYAINLQGLRMLLANHGYRSAINVLSGTARLK